MPKITQEQLAALMQKQYELYLLQQAFGVGDELKSRMDAVQKLTRVLATDPIPVPPADPIARFRARQAVSQNCAWYQIDGGETAALEALFNPNVITNYVQFYQGGGSGGMNINERAWLPGDPPSASGYVFVNALGSWEADVDGAADARVAAVAASQEPPRDVPGSLVFPPS